MEYQLSGYLKTSLVEIPEITSAVERMVLPVDPNFEKDQTNDAGKLIIHDMASHNPFSLHIKDRGNFNSSPPSGLYASLTTVFDFTTPLITTSTDRFIRSILNIIAYSMIR